MATHVTDSRRAPSNSIRPAFYAELAIDAHVERALPRSALESRTPVASVLGPRSCHTKTQPDLGRDEIFRGDTTSEEGKRNVRNRAPLVRVQTASHHWKNAERDGVEYNLGVGRRTYANACCRWAHVL